MFTEWLNGGHDLQPPTWDVLIQSLTAANLMEIADILSCTIEIVSFNLIQLVIIIKTYNSFNNNIIIINQTF